MKHIAVIPKDQIECVDIYINVSKKTMAAIKKEKGYHYILNGGLFTSKTFTPNCHLRSNGKTYAYDQWLYRGFGWDKANVTSMLSSHKESVKNYICCTELVTNGSPIAKPIYDAPQGGSRGRSAMGLMPNKDLVLYCSKDYTADKKTPEQLRDELVSLGLDFAIMLDSGGSSQCDFLGKTITSTRKVHNFICVKLKDGIINPYKKPSSTLRYGSRGEGVKWMQWQLNKWGVCLDVDGIYGNDTKGAVLEFQRSVFTDKKEWDGICGSKTRAKLANI